MALFRKYLVAFLILIILTLGIITWFVFRDNSNKNPPYRAKLVLKKGGINFNTTQLN